MGFVFALAAIPSVSFAAPTAVDLGAASTFAVLAGTTITNTGSTQINGNTGRDLGAYPGMNMTKNADSALNESVSFSNIDAKQAHEDLVAAYNDAAGRAPVTRIDKELGGTTLLPGVYDSASGTFELNGTLILDGKGDPDGVFIFLTESTLVTASNSRVDTIGSARYGHIFWNVGSSASLGTNSRFAGHILATTDIEAHKGATIQGQLLAINGEVVLNNNNISNGIPASIQTSTLSGEETPISKIPWYGILMFGMGVALFGAVIWCLQRRYQYNKRNLT